MEDLKLAASMLIVFILILSGLSISLIARHFVYIPADGAFLSGYKCPDCNVVLISVDTLRADHLGCYGYHRNTSPNIDRLASDAVLFENAFSNSHWTLPSHMSIMTSQYPSAHDVNFFYSNEQRLDESKTTLAEVLKSSDYKTVAFTGGGLVDPMFGFDQGFDGYNVIDTSYENTELLNEIFGWLENNHNEKFFMFVHTYSVHAPYLPPGPFKGTFSDSYSGSIIDSLDEMKRAHSANLSRFKLFLNSINTSDPSDVYHAVALYDEGILYMDHCIGQLMKRLEGLGLGEKTLVVFTSDHGEDLTEHGVIALHGYLYDEQVHVPLIIRLPGKNSGTVKTPAQGIDVMPTTLDILDIAQPSSVQGESLFSKPENSSSPIIFTEKGYSCHFFYHSISASLASNASLCIRIGPSLMGYELCLGQLNISVCDNLPRKLKIKCKRLNHFHETNNHTHNLYASLILDSILENKTASETCEEVHREISSYSEPFHDAAVRTEEFKYVYVYDGQDELYDIIQDPAEQKNIIRERPGIARDLRTELLEWYEKNRDLRDVDYTEQPRLQIDEETLEQLKALGYLN